MERRIEAKPMGAVLEEYRGRICSAESALGSEHLAQFPVQAFEVIVAGLELGTDHEWAVVLPTAVDRELRVRAGRVLAMASTAQELHSEQDSLAARGIPLQYVSARLEPALQSCATREASCLSRGFPIG